MLLQLSVLKDVIPQDTISALRAAIQADEKPKMPSSTARRGIASTNAQQGQMFTKTFELAYNNCDWDSCADLAPAFDEGILPLSDLTRVRCAISAAIGKPYNEASPVLSHLVEYINKYPAFGDLYVALAGLKVSVGQIDSASQLLELSALCSHDHPSAHELMKDKVDRLMALWKFHVNAFRHRMADPANHDIIMSFIPAEATEDFTEIIKSNFEKLRENPSLAFEMWQSSTEMQSFMNRVYDRVHLLFPKPSQPAPIEGLSPEVTLKLLQYLDFPSILKLRASSPELSKTVTSSTYWVALFKELIGQDFEASIWGSISVTPFNTLLCLKSIPYMLKVLEGPSEFGYIEEEAFTPVMFTSSCDCVRTLSAGLPYSVIPISCFVASLFVFVGSVNSSATTLIMDTPGALSTLVRLVLHSIFPVQVTINVMHFLIFMVVSNSPRRAELVATLRHWRFGQALFKFGLLDPESPFYSIGNALYGALSAADVCQSYQPLPLPITDALEDEVWWVAITDPTPNGYETSESRLVLQLKWIPGEDGVCSIEGSVMSPSTKPVTGTFDGTTMKLTMGSSSQDKLTLTADYVGLGAAPLFFTGFVAVESGSENRTVGSCFVWRDPSRSSPEFWANLLPVPSAPAWFLPPGNEDWLRSANMTRMLQGIMYSGSHYLRTIETEQLLAGIPTLAEMAGNPDVPPTWSSHLIKHRFESDAAFNSRRTIFLGACVMLNHDRFNLFQELVVHDLDIAKLERDLLLDALRSAYATAPEDTLIAAGVVNPRGAPNISSKPKLLDSLHRSNGISTRLPIIAAILAQKELLFGTSKFMEASAEILDEVVRSGVGNPSHTVMDFVDAETHINGIYRKYSGLLNFLHPALCSHEIPFSFEEVLAYLSHFIELTERARAELETETSMNANMNDLISGSLNRAKSGRESGLSTGTLWALVGAGALSALAVGFGAFMVGRYLNKN